MFELCFFIITDISMFELFQHNLYWIEKVLEYKVHVQNYFTLYFDDFESTFFYFSYGWFI